MGTGALPAAMNHTGPVLSYVDWTELLRAGGGREREHNENDSIDALPCATSEAVRPVPS